MAARRFGWHFLVWDFNQLLPDHRLEVSDQNWWHWGEDELYISYDDPQAFLLPDSKRAVSLQILCLRNLLQNVSSNYCWSWHPANIFFMQMLLDVENRTENSNGCMAYLAGPSFRSSLRQWIWCGMIILTEWTVGFAQTYSCQWVGCSHWCQRLRWKITALRDGYATKAWWKSYVQGAMWRWIISLQSFRRSLDIFTSLTCTRHQCKVQPVSVDCASKVGSHFS